MKNSLIIVIIIIFFSNGCAVTQKKSKPREMKPQMYEVVRTNVEGKGIAIEIEMTKGKSHNHPLMAVWAEDTLGKYIQTFYVSESIARGVFTYGDKNSGKWQPGEVRRPASLPYWAHKRNVRERDSLYIPTPDNPVPDTYTGATPRGNFTLQTKTDEKRQDLINILFEINQSWDWNWYWTNDKYPGDKEYLTSSQPAIVYMATVDLSKPGSEYIMKPIGRSHYSGADGKLYIDLGTLTTALQIALKITVRVK